VIAVACLATLSLGLEACGGSSTPKPGTAVADYLAAWTNRQWSTMATMVADSPADFAAEHTTVLSDLGASSVIYTPGAVVRKGSAASVPITSTYTLASKIPLVLHSTLHLVLVDKQWRVQWSPETISSSLAAGDQFAITTTWPTRAQVLGAGGASLIPDTTAVIVGLAGLRIKDPTTLRAALVGAGLEGTDVDQALAAAKKHPDDFEPIQTLSESAYSAIKAVIYPLPGTQFETTKQPTPLTPALGAQVVGQLGPITAQELKTLGAPYAVGDLVGQGGIEEAYEKQLAGSPTLKVVLLGPATKTSSGPLLSTLASKGGVAPKPVQTSINPTVQAAAEGALVGDTKPSAIVVMQASTGEVLASVSTPTDGFNLAFGATVPPGSTFKIITSTALLQNGVTPTTTTTCPPTVTIDGKTFHNDEGETTPSLSFLQAFAESCNTAFIGLSAGLSDASLPATAATYGIGVTPQMGLAAYGGKVPTPASPVDLAATAIGQSQVTVSPLAMATVAAAVDSGSLHEPRLVAGAPDDSIAPKPLDPSVVASLHTLMTSVEAPGGTAAGAGLPAGVFGKTGTAEYGSGANPPTHAWFIGFDADLAFAVFVYGGGTGGVVAAPIAAKMLDTLGPAA
jgi:cell division protein FtsI/penicillin-binding protein 2